MADRELTMRLKVQTDNSDAMRKLDETAKAAERTGQKASQAMSSARISGGAAIPSARPGTRAAMDFGEKVTAAADRIREQRAIDETVKKWYPELFKEPDGKPLSQLLGGRVGRWAGMAGRNTGPLASIAATAALAGSLDIVDIDQQRNLAQSVGAVGYGALGKIPFVGGWLQGGIDKVGSTVGAFTGKNYLDAEAAKTLNFITRQGQLAGAAGDIRAEGRGHLYDVASARNQTATDAAASTAWANRLSGNPALMKSFVTEDRIGVSDTATGAARLASEEARAAVASGPMATAAARKLRDEQAGRLSAAEGAEQDAQSRWLYAKNRSSAVDAAERSSWTDISGGLKKSRIEADQNLLRESLNLENAKTRTIQEREALLKAENDLNSKGNDLAQRKLDLAKAEMAEGQNKLGVLRAENQSVRSGAIQYADMMPGERNALLFDARQFTEQGYDSLNPAQKQRLRALPFAAQALDNAGAQSGSAAPGYSDLTGMFGVRGLNEGKANADEYQKSLIKDYGEKLSQIKTALAADNDRWATSIVDLINKNMEARVRLVEQKLESQLQSQTLQRTR